MVVNRIKKEIIKLSKKWNLRKQENYKAKVRRQLKGFDYSIISNNCWGGRAYQFLGLPYLSPTAGLYFFAEDYVRFVSNLKYYLSLELNFISAEESRYADELRNRNQLNVPIGVLDDVEIVFLHYKTKEEAAEKWNRRKARVNYDKLIFKFSNMNLCTEEIEDSFMRLPLENKFFINNIKRRKYTNEYYYKEEVQHEDLHGDTNPFPGTVPLEKVLGLKKRNR